MVPGPDGGHGALEHSSRRPQTETGVGDSAA
nr:MAG TPA: hypothetical protein [Caudoviricetes sp.]